MSCMYFPRQLRPPDDSTESSDSITYWRKLLAVGEEIAEEARKMGRGDVSGRGRPVVGGAPGGEYRGSAAVSGDGAGAAPHALEVEREGVDQRGGARGRGGVQHERNKYADST